MNPDFITDFLLGGSRLQAGNRSIRADIEFGPRAEGWIGIPHGGIAMGTVVELASRMDPGQSISHPFTADFRMGGSRLRIGDRASVEVSAGEKGIEGRIVPESGGAPYLSALLSGDAADACARTLIPSYLPARLTDFKDKLEPLPFYKNCFVCGAERKEPGLKRKFHLVAGPERAVVSLAGFDPEDSGSFYLFQENGILHPVGLLALIDETAGWAGFMISASAGVTTRISYTFLREVGAGEKIAVFARGDRVRRTSTRTMFWASGAAAVVKEDGSLEAVAAATGQYLGMQEYTDQMRVELMPREITARAFSIAETPR